MRILGVGGGCTLVGRFLKYRRMVLLPNETFFFEGGRLFVWAYLRPLLARMLLIARSRSFSS